MEFDYDYSNGNCNLIYSSGGGKEIDERIWGIVKADPERLYLLPVRIEKTWSGYLLFYDIRYATNMMAWRSMASRQDLLRMDRQIQVAVEQIENAGIRRDYLVLQEKHMFVDDRNGEIRFICIPLKDMEPAPAIERAPVRPAPVRPAPVMESAPVRPAPVMESAPVRPAPAMESAPDPVRPVGDFGSSQRAADLPPYTPSSPDEWNPAEGRDAWTPESESWGDSWSPSGDSWNPSGDSWGSSGDSWSPSGDSWSQSGDSWSPSGDGASSSGDSWGSSGDGWNPAEGRDLWEKEGEDWSPAKDTSDEWHPEPEAAKEPGAPESAVPEPEIKKEEPVQAVRPDDSMKENPAPVVYEEDDDEATELLLPSQRAALGEVPAAVITRIRTGESYTIRKPETTIGKRERTVDFCLKNNPALSRDHCVIRYKDGDFYIEDLNSSNFTYVDGTRVMPETERILKSGSKIQLADEQFLFTVE